MDFLLVLVPFFVMGFICATLSRFTGVTISFLVAPATLYMGAKPIEFIAFMLTFLIYYNFTQETQYTRLDFKNLTFFGGWKKYAFLVAIILSAVVAPFVSIAVFIFAFIVELGAILYRQEPESQRPAVSMLIKHGLLSAIFAIVGVGVMHAVPADYYYLLVGAGILGLTAFAWYAGKNRSAMRSSWLNIWTGLCFFQGFLGIDSSSYIKGLKRLGTKGQNLFGLVSMTATFAALMTLFIVDRAYSMPALLAALGAAMGTRILGVYEYNNRGGFSVVAIAIAVLAVLCLYLTEPSPTGFSAVDALFGLQP